MIIAKLELSKSVYTYENIIQTMAVYKDFASIKIKEKKDRWILQFNNCRYDKNLTIKEFENYLIGTENR